MNSKLNLKIQVKLELKKLKKLLICKLNLFFELNQELLFFIKTLGFIINLHINKQQ